jgi:DNA-binding transcriptional MerR regulator
MSELSERSGLPVASIKYYQREGLVPFGEHTSKNQSQYSDAHVDRLRLVRALIEVGGLSVSSAKAVLAAIDNTEMPLDWAFGIAQRAASKSVPAVDDAPGAEAVQRVAALIDDRGLLVTTINPGRATVARVLETYQALGRSELVDTLPAYLDAAMLVAAADLGAVGAAGESSAGQRAAMTETVVVGTVLGDTMFAGLRRIAQEHLSHTYYPAPTGSTDIDCEDEEE